MITDVGMTSQLNITYGVNLGTVGIGTLTVFEISLLRGRVDRNPNNTYTFKKILCSTTQLDSPFGLDMVPFPTRIIQGKS